MFIPFYAFEPL